MKIPVLVVATALLSGAVAPPALCAAGLEIEVAPPPPRIIHAPPPRPGFVWAPGYYRWDGHRHIWVDGRFIRERRGAHWVPEHWVEHHGRWRFEPGHWAPN